MEMEQQQIEHNNDSMTISQPAQRSSEILGWLAEQITVLAEAMGEPMTPARLKIYVGDLSDLDRSQLEIAFARARRELKFFPKIAEVRELAGRGAKQQGEAEARAAWELVQKFATKYVSNDVYGNFGPEHGWYPKTYPKLSDRILDTIRRTGDWKVYKCMDSDDLPFVQKRFFEEYEAWQAVQHISLDRLLEAKAMLTLQAPKRPSRPAPPEQVKADQIVDVCLKSVPAPVPMTEVQLRDRREILRRQAEFVHRKYRATHKGECSSLSREKQEQYAKFSRR